jgi:DNA-binding CsgD family transcriptional regulator
MSRSVLVGRDAEVEVLRALMRDAVRGKGRSASVEGEPGIGKSALMDLVADECARLGMDTLRCTAEEMERQVPFAALSNCLGIGTTPGARGAWIRSLLGVDEPELAFDGISITNSEFAVTEAIVDLVEQRCAVRPVALLVDDVQWADPATLLVLHRLGRTIAQLPLLIVVTYRSVPRDPDLERLLRSLTARGLVSISLGPLPRLDAAGLVRRLTGAQPGRSLTGLVGGAAGNPLYINELIAALLRDERIEIVDGVAELTGGTIAVTQSLAGAVVRRLEFLSRRARDVLQVAAVLGPGLKPTELSVILDSPASELLAVVREAVDVGLLVDSGEQLLFRHELIRQALAENVPATARSALHLQAAQALAERGGQVERVAHHLLAGDIVHDWVLDWAMRAAQPLIARAPALAVDLLGRALEQVADDDERGQALRYFRARALLWAARHEEAEAAARAALAVNHEPNRTGALSWLLAQACFQQGRLRNAQEVCENALAAGPLTTLETARFQHFAAQCRLLRGQIDPPPEEATAQAVLARGDADSTAVGLYYMSGVRYVQERMAESLELMDRAIAAFGAREAEPDWDTPINFYRACILLELDRTVEAENAFETGLRQAGRHGSIFLTWYHLGKARLQFLTGRWDDALAEVQAGLDAIDTLRGAPALHTERGLHRQVAVIAIHRGDAATSAAVAGEPYLPGRGAFYDYLDLWAHALAWEAQGEPQRALDLLFESWEKSAGFRQQRGLHNVCPDLARLAVLLGENARAEQMTECLREMSDRQPSPSLRGIFELCRGVLDADPELVIKSAGAFEAAGRPLFEGYAHENAAALLAGAGRIGEARVALATALEHYDRLDATWDAARAKARLRKYGIRSRRSNVSQRAKTGWDALTDTERRVALQVAEGRSNPDIAAGMFISRRTVQSHVSSILTKLNCTSRVELAVEVSRHASPPPSPSPAPLP